MTYEILPASTDGPKFDSHQFDGQRPLPVSSASKLDYSDFSRMHTHRRAQCGKKTKPPEWALSDVLLRQVIVHYLEKRALLSKPGHGPLLDRLRKAENEILNNSLRQVELLRELCQRYASAKNSNHVRTAKKLDVQIENLDTSLSVLKAGKLAAVIAAIPVLYWRCGYDSVGVGQILNLKPPMVRQIVHRLGRCWKEIQGETSPGKRGRPRKLPLLPLASR